MIKSHFVGTLFFWLSVDGSILSSSDALIREIFGFVPVSDTYWIRIRVGYGYKHTQSVSKQKKRFLYSGYGPDTVKIRPATSWIRGGKKRGKKIKEYKEILGRNKYCRRSPQVAPGPVTHPLVFSPLRFFVVLHLLCFSNLMFLFYLSFSSNSAMRILRSTAISL